MTAIPIGAKVKRALLGIAVIILTACTHSVQTWPVPLAPGAKVTARFAQPHLISSDTFSVTTSEVSGRVVATRRDTLVVRLAQRPAESTDARWIGREVAIPLDSTTRVLRHEVDGWAVSFGILAAAVLTFAGVVISSD